MSNGKRWTAEDKARLRELVAANTPIQAIATELGRTEPAVRARLTKLNLTSSLIDGKQGVPKAASRWRPKLSIGAIAALVALTGFVAEEYNKTFPVVEIKGDFDEVHPFNNPLNIKNQSALFDMHDVKATCAFTATWAMGVPSRGADLHAYQVSLITAHEPFVFISEVGSSFYFGKKGDPKSVPLKQGQIIVHIEYETWFDFWAFKFRWPRDRTVQLNYIQSPAPHWIQGTKIL
jgi:hypothetical protein